MLHGIDLIVFDKDGTLIEFESMWRDWAIDLAEHLSGAVGRDVSPPLYTMLGFDPATGRVAPQGGLAATPMTRLRETIQALLIDGGSSGVEASAAMDRAWHAPDPVTTARPLADLRPLFTDLRVGGRRIAVATSDDREPTERTLVALGVDDLVDATVCADDGVPVKPAPDMVARVCAIVGVDPARTAVVGDSPADLQMGRSAGVGLVVAVLTGVGVRADLGPLADRVIGSVEQLRTG